MKDIIILTTNKKKESLLEDIADITIPVDVAQISSPIDLA